MNWSPRSTNAMCPPRPRSSTRSTSSPRNSSISPMSPTCTATWLIPTSLAMGLAGRLGPNAGQVHDRRGRGRHVLDAGPFADRVVLLAAREQVRGRQPLGRQHRAVRAAPCDREAGLDAGAANRLQRSLHDERVLLDERTHVSIRVSHLDVDLRARLASLDAAREIAQEVEVLLEERVVVIAGDEI